MPKLKNRNIISVDTETTGIDFFHGSKPFLVTMCSLSGENCWWEWDVDPLTRQPRIPKQDKKDIQKIINENTCVFHNAKFDAHALKSVGIEVNWGNTLDTMLYAHALNSSFPMNLTDLCVSYLGINIEGFEDTIEKIVKECREISRKKYPDWRIAKEGLKDMPSIKGGNEEDKPWKCDMWLPKAIVKKQQIQNDFFENSCLEYANGDTFATIKLFECLYIKAKQRGLLKIIKERHKSLRIVYEMERVGITIDPEREKNTRLSYTKTLKKAEQACFEISKKFEYELVFPKGHMNNSLREFCFDRKYLNLPKVKNSKSGNPSLDKEAKEIYINTLPDGNRKLFVENLKKRTEISTALGYMDSYRKFQVNNILHSSVNMTATRTLRTNSRNPNQQQISKKEMNENHGVRYMFGPQNGYEWWSMDFDNFELRIPAYESGEQAMLELFESPDKSPYFGSYHSLICHILHKEEFEKYKDGNEFKKNRPDLYRRAKAGNFAELCGAVDTMDGKSTADKTFGVPGAQRIIASRLKEKNNLNEKLKEFANEHGYVETIPDLSVDPNKGYPIICDMTGNGTFKRAKPTQPMSYHVQGTACWIVFKAMTRVNKYLKTLGPDYRIIMNIHDELSFSFPFKDNLGNLKKARRVREIMEECGTDVGVKLTCGMDYHPNNWEKSEYSE
jgi:DNA polymerase I-like protein with 3'-5' exonuclease and polymerase domains